MLPFILLLVSLSPCLLACFASFPPSGFPFFRVIPRPPDHRPDVPTFFCLSDFYLFGRIVQWTSPRSLFLHHSLVILFSMSVYSS